jgi:hypothetical protein
MRNMLRVQERQHEAKIKRLENAFDKGTKHHRDYMDALADIRDLQRENKIDAGHADILSQGAKEVYDKKELPFKLRRHSKRVEDKIIPLFIGALVTIFIAVLLPFLLFIL